MEEIQTSEVDAKPTPARRHLSKVKSANDGKQTIVVWPLRPQ
jgi:hypothetical protein